MQSVPIIDIPGFGTLAAETVCKQLGVKNAGDAKKLAEAKAMVYLKGFTAGVLTVGNYKGTKVSDGCSVPIAFVAIWRLVHHQSKGRSMHHRSRGRSMQHRSKGS
jgi:hypothetical protein